MTEDMNNKPGTGSGYEPNFILKPAKPEAASGDAAKAADSSATPKAGPKPEPSEALKAAAAKAEALKAAAARAGSSRINGANDPYRRDTAEIGPDGRQAIFHGPTYHTGPYAGASGTGSSSAGSSGAGSFGAGSFGAGSSGAGGSASAQAGNGPAENTQSGGAQVQAGAQGYGSASYSATGAAGAQGYGAATGAAGAQGYGAAGASSARNSSGASANAGAANGRPAFENPSFDPGKTGRYTDPRDSFRFGESASWSNGEVHRSRKQMKDSINKQKKQKKTSQPVTLTRRTLGLLIACCMLVSCLFGVGGAALTTTMLTQNQPTASAVPTTASTAGASGSEGTTSSTGYSLENATGSSMTVKEITSAAKDSIVEIRTESVSSDTWMQQYVTQGAGSGVIISKDGYIMTNNHVIEGANKITVTTANSKEYEAKLVGADDTNDVAVIKIEASDLTPATYGNSDQLEVGDMAVAIGNPLGELGGTVTAGIISATDRALSIDGKTLHLLQTDSSINPGNSGGGLFNGSGQLIGLVVAKSSGSDVEGLGFAIPINKAADVAQQLMDKGYVSGEPSTGMTYTEGSSAGSGSDPFSSFDSFFGGGGGATGVFIYSVNGENAKKAGFEPGDQVYAVDGEEIASFNDLSAIITSHKVGDKLTFTIIRGGTQKNIKLELEEKTNTNQNNSGTDQNGQSGTDQNGQTAPDDGQNSPDQDGQQMIPDQDAENGQSGPGSWQDLFNMFW